FLVAACATVLVGTLYPLLLEMATGEKISVGPPFFNATFLPLAVPLLLLVPFGQLLAWKRGDLLGASQRLVAAGLLSLATLIFVIAWTSGGAVLAPCAIALA
ncbi:cytochrome c-type biogenesis CcmF C-terminal domain-containing protein, partial [Klebsiella pneumoniae]|uniref:cytochrome c-type biogenesis CcmF C-terminal domain-containing protein n=1 Tax=Klebsiella pneumoniae TaxID=573 RepID=UPI0034D6B84D